jgi:hypothetical protein
MRAIGVTILGDNLLAIALHQHAGRVKSQRSTKAYGCCIDGLTAMSDVDLLQLATYKGRRETRFDILGDA